MESINPAALGFALLCSSFPNPISSMSSQRTFIRARFLDYLPPSPSLPAAAPYCCALKCIKLNEVSVQVSSPPPPATPCLPHPLPRISLLVIKGEVPLPLPGGFVAAMLHKLPFIRAQEEVWREWAEKEHTGASRSSKAKLNKINKLWEG